ncbi:MAG: energy-coupling factor transporter ATPase [Oscillospiraceae bacterium]|nr:energy-coupling factor transporter ATPase [Oscillospiraceae bacterium]
MASIAQLIVGSDISYSYEYDSSVKPALENVNIEIKKGELVAILGQNGSGKSTLVKHFNSLLRLQNGKLTISGIDASDENGIWQLRRKCGMVFQNPDNQFVSSVINDDIAFGLENYETPREIIPQKVEAALRLVGMESFNERSTHSLSGGQKQRIALAGVLVLDPDIIIFDEATAMLDPEGRDEVLDMIRRLHKIERKTVVMITHYVEEAVIADTVWLMDGGRILSHGSPREILSDAGLMNNAGLIPPVAVRLYYDLKAAGIDLGRCPLTNEELTEEICRLQLK